MTTTSTAAGTPQGRLADPDRSLSTDPRTDPGLLQVLQPLGLADNPPPSEVTSESDIEQVHAAMTAADEGFTGLYEAMPNDLPEDPGVKVEQETVTVPGENPVDIHIWRPAGVSGPLPGVVYLHGGGMVILPTRVKVHDQWCTSIAAAGAVALQVDFRNALQPDGFAAFPASLDDCLNAVKWINENRADLGISSVVLQGESGGANLGLATALRAKREGLTDAIDGVYANVPYVSGGYDWDEDRKRRELPSLIENDGYFIGLESLAMMVRSYDPEYQHREDPLAWPYFATEDDVAGLPPHVISVNELDPLRDEGLAYYRKLLTSGVEVRARLNFGIVHGAEMIFRKAVPQHYRAAVSDIVGFAAVRAAQR